MGVCNGKRSHEILKPKKDYETEWGLFTELLLVQHFNSPATVQTMINNNQTFKEDI